MFMALSAPQKFVIAGADISSPYLYGDLERDLYMEKSCDSI